MSVYISLGFCLLILWLFNLPQIANNDVKNKNFIFLNRIFITSIFIFLFFLSYFRGINVGTDYFLYYRFFQTELYKEFFDPFIVKMFDVSVYFDDFRIITLISTIIFLTIFFYLQKKFAYNPVNFTLMFVLSFLYFFFLNGLRQALAMSILWIGLMCLKQPNLKGKIKFVVMVIIAAQFHISAYMALFFFFISKLRVNIPLLTLSFFLVTMGFFTDFIRDNIESLLLTIDFYRNKYINNLDYFFSVNKEKGIIQFIPIFVQFIFFFMWLVFKKWKDFEGDKMIESYYLFYLLFYSASGIEAVDRFQFYLYPSIIFFYDMIMFYFIKYGKTKKEMIISWFFCFLVVTFWFLYFVLRLIQNTHGVVPYLLWE